MCASGQEITPRHYQAWLFWCLQRVDWRVEWRSIVLSDENRFCLYASDVCPTLGTISYNSRSHLVLLQGKVNSTRYNSQVNTELMPFLRQEGDVLSQQDNARPHTAAGTQCALCGVRQLPWPARIPDLSQIEYAWHMMKREFTLPPEPGITIAEMRQRVQDA